MQQINNGIAEYYYIEEDGQVYNNKDNCIVKADKKHILKIRDKENKRVSISLKTLYKKVYGKPFCKDQIKDLQNEQWKEIEGTEGNLYISNKGRIKSYHGYNAVLLKGYTNQRGYLRIDIRKYGKRYSVLIHRLVAAAFLQMPPSMDYQLHHKDFNKSNNASDNLEWIKPSDHAEKHRIHNIKENIINVCTKSEENNDRTNK